MGHAYEREDITPAFPGSTKLGQLMGSNIGTSLKSDRPVSEVEQEMMNLEGTLHYLHKRIETLTARFGPVLDLRERPEEPRARNGGEIETTPASPARREHQAPRGPRERRRREAGFAPGAPHNIAMRLELTVTESDGKVKHLEFGSFEELNKYVQSRRDPGFASVDMKIEPVGNLYTVPPKRGIMQRIFNI